MKLIWRNGIFVPDDGNAAASSQINAEAMFLAMLDAYTKQERNVSAVTGTSYAPTIFSRDPACKGVDMKVLAGRPSLPGPWPCCLRLFLILETRVARGAKPSPKRGLSAPEGL
jgi:hypothetical protein